MRAGSSDSYMCTGARARALMQVHATAVRMMRMRMRALMIGTSYAAVTRVLHVPVPELGSSVLQQREGDPVSVRVIMVTRARAWVVG